MQYKTKAHKIQVDMWCDWH